MPLLARACRAGRGRGRAKSASFCALLAFFAPFSASLALLPAHFRAGFSHTLRAHGACHAAAVQSAKNGPGAPRRRLLCRFGGFFACLRHLCRRFSALRAAFRPKFSPATPLQHARANGAKKKFCIFGAEKSFSLGGKGGKFLGGWRFLWFLGVLGNVAGFFWGGLRVGRCGGGVAGAGGAVA